MTTFTNSIEWRRKKARQWLDLGPIKKQQSLTPKEKAHFDLSAMVNSWYAKIIFSVQAKFCISHLDEYVSIVFVLLVFSFVWISFITIVLKICICNDLYLYLTMMALVWNVGIISSDRTPCAVCGQIAELMSHNQAIRRWWQWSNSKR